MTDVKYIKKIFRKKKTKVVYINEIFESQLVHRSVLEKIIIYRYILSDIYFNRFRINISYYNTRLTPCFSFFSQKLCL